jgi:2-C-methyl-D-erythritol 4-phosphate cytidylyltransferase
MTTAVLVLAGGSGSRLHRPENKVYLPVGGQPLLAWSLRTFDRSPDVSRIVVVVRAGDRERASAVVAAVAPRAAVDFATGGTTRHDSELAGLEVLADAIVAATVDVVLVHDAARPFAGAALVERVVDAAGRVGGAIPTLPLGAGVYRVDDDGRLIAQPADLHRAQTPQGFLAAPLLEAYRRASADGFSGVDTCETVQHYTDLPVAAVSGDPRNLKVTYADDLAAAERLATGRHG